VSFVGALDLINCAENLSTTVGCVILKKSDFSVAAISPLILLQPGVRRLKHVSTTCSIKRSTKPTSVFYKLVCLPLEYSAQSCLPLAACYL
jgi:hypothetical protein